PRPTLFPYTTLFRSRTDEAIELATATSIELAEIRAELDGERWKNKKRELLLAGVKPAILKIAGVAELAVGRGAAIELANGTTIRSEEHTSELQSPDH